MSAADDSPLADFSFKSLAVPGALTVIAFLGASSQWLLASLDPHPLTYNQTLILNTLIVSLLISYTRLLRTSPGFVPHGWKPSSASTAKGRPWCQKCKADKPPRAHHCKICKRCVLKMDHHCPWTRNCIALCTIPHYIRFLIYAVSALVHIESLLFVRLTAMWEKRNMPYYHGPSMVQLAHFLVLGLVNSFTLFAIFILFVRSIWSLGENTTTIEGWEIERHKALLRRARISGGYLNGPGGAKIRLVKQEFPYDIGIWSNLVQAMGTRNPIAWFWPFAASPSLESGFDFEVNGFEDRDKHWPPPDPDRMKTAMPMLNNDSRLSGPRQAVDSQSRTAQGGETRHRILGNAGDQDNHQRNTWSSSNEVNYQHDEHDDREVNDEDDEGEPARWKNWEGETLDDFGVDEGAELYLEE